MKEGDGLQRIEPALDDRLFCDSPDSTDGQSAEGGKYIPEVKKDVQRDGDKT